MAIFLTHELDFLNWNAENVFGQLPVGSTNSNIATASLTAITLSSVTYLNVGDYVEFSNSNIETVRISAIDRTNKVITISPALAHTYPIGSSIKLKYKAIQGYLEEVDIEETRDPEIVHVVGKDDMFPKDVFPRTMRGRMILKYLFGRDDILIGNTRTHKSSLIGSAFGTFISWDHTISVSKRKTSDINSFSFWFRHQSGDERFIVGAIPNEIEEAYERDGFIRVSITFLYATSRERLPADTLLTPDLESYFAQYFVCRGETPVTAQYEGRLKKDVLNDTVVHLDYVDFLSVHDEVTLYDDLTSLTRSITRIDPINLSVSLSSAVTFSKHKSWLRSANQNWEIDSLTLRLNNNAEQIDVVGDKASISKIPGKAQEVTARVDKFKSDFLIERMLRRNAYWNRIRLKVDFRRGARTYRTVALKQCVAITPSSRRKTGTIELEREEFELRAYGVDYTIADMP